MLRRKKSNNAKRKLALANRIKQDTKSITLFSVDEKLAETQGIAIIKHNKLALKAPRINFTYMLDGFAVPSGKKHRQIG